MKKIKLLTIILAVILIIMVGFFGIYHQVQNRMENSVKDYSYAMDLSGVRTIRLQVSDEVNTVVKDTEGNEVEDQENLTDEQITEKGYVKEETPYNSEEVKNLDNYKKTKEIIEKRLDQLGISNYIVKLNEQNGDIAIDIVEDENIDNTIGLMCSQGKFEIIDSTTKEVLMDNNDIKDVKVMTGQASSTSTGTAVYLDIEFNKEGTTKLEQISNDYKKVENTTDTNTTTSNETSEENNTTTDETSTTEEEKQITLKIDDEEIMTSSFSEPIRTGKMQLSMGNATSSIESLQQTARQASNIATVLKTGNEPVRYEVIEDQYVFSEITAQNLQIVGYIALGIIAIAIIVLIIRYKLLGVFTSIAYVGFISALLLVIRYTNVVLSIEGFLGIAIIVALNYILVNKLLKEPDTKTYEKFFVKVLPIIILSIVFSLIRWVPINSFGATTLWGFALMIVYNIIITSNLIKIGKEK